MHCSTKTEGSCFFPHPHSREKENGNLPKKTLGPSSISRTLEPGTSAPASQTTMFNPALSTASTTVFQAPSSCLQLNSPFVLPSSPARKLLQAFNTAQLNCKSKIPHIALAFVSKARALQAQENRMVSKPSSTGACLQCFCQPRDGLFCTNESIIIIST